MLSNFSLQKWISQICHFGIQQRREGVEAVELVDFTSDGNLKHLEWLEDHLALVSADDVVKHQQWTENHIDTVVVVDNVNHQKWTQNHGHLTSSDEPVKHLEWLYNQKSLSSYIDQVHNLELLENHLDLTPTADSVHVELLKNIGGLTAAADPVKYLEWLVNNRELTMFIKNQIHTLKLEMGFLRTYLKGMEGKDMVHKFRHEIKDFIQNTASELHSLCLRPETDGIVIRDLQLLVSSTLEKLNTYKPDIRFHYACTYLIARSDAPTKDEIIMELVVSLLENLKDLQSCKTDLIASVKTHIEAL
ncbi:hypothetical protein Pfo_023784 [Paulownia fortunei]|nr:hypothetical protein Pfo_023784 [Paulownia fortunei]